MSGSSRTLSGERSSDSISNSRGDCPREFSDSRNKSDFTHLGKVY